MQAEPPRKKVLVVEDDCVTREWLGATLARAGYGVAAAADGPEALAMLGAGPAPDLILLDVFMPVAAGWQFLGRLRRQAPPQPTPVIVTTAARILTREWALGHGCSGFLRKPFEADELLGEVRRCLDER
jgi:two-component system, OmpR family, response regulator